MRVWGSPAPSRPSATWPTAAASALSRRSLSLTTQEPKKPHAYLAKVGPFLSSPVQLWNLGDYQSRRWGVIRSHNWDAGAWRKLGRFTSGSCQRQAFCDCSTARSPLLLPLEKLSPCVCSLQSRWRRKSN